MPDSERNISRQPFLSSDDVPAHALPSYASAPTASLAVRRRRSRANSVECCRETGLRLAAGLYHLAPDLGSDRLNQRARPSRASRVIHQAGFSGAGVSGSKNESRSCGGDLPQHLSIHLFIWGLGAGCLPFMVCNVDMHRKHENRGCSRNPGRCLPGEAHSKSARSSLSAASTAQKEYRNQSQSNQARSHWLWNHGAGARRPASDATCNVISSGRPKAENR
jgi:hypothetical protein